MSMIELGDVSAAATPPPPRSLRLGGGSRRVVAACLVALCLLTLAGSADAASTGTRIGWVVPYENGGLPFAVTEGGVYTYAGETSVLTARDRGTGRIRWETALPSGEPVAVDAMPGLALVSVSNTNGEFDSQRTLGLDEGTGAVRWEAPGLAVLRTDRQAVLADHDGDLVTLRTLDAGGAQLWSRPPAVAAVADTSDPGRLLTVSRTGAAELLDAADGQVLRRGRLPWSADGSRATLAAGALVVQRVTDRGTEISVHDPATLAKRWGIDHEAVGELLPCGPVLCLNSELGTSGHDPATGRTLWERPVGQVTGLGGGVGLADEAPGSFRRSLVDLTTGQVRAHTARRVEAAAGERTYLLTLAEEEGGPMAIDEVRGGRVAPLGAVPAVPWPQECRAAGGTLVCPSEERTVLIGITLRSPGA